MMILSNYDMYTVVHRKWYMLCAVLETSRLDHCREGSHVEHLINAVFSMTAIRCNRSTLNRFQNLMIARSV